jgi:hypothetical protein
MKKPQNNKRAAKKSSPRGKTRATKKKAAPGHEASTDANDAERPSATQLLSPGILIQAGLGHVKLGSGSDFWTTVADSYKRKADKPVSTGGDTTAADPPKHLDPPEESEAPPKVLVPGSAHWKQISRNLLEDESYRPKATLLSKLGGHDLVRILSSIPFRLRKQALMLYLRGVRGFAKIPYHVTESPPGYRPHEDAEVHVRPLACPEPAPEGQEFGLAWYEGQFLKSEPPRFNISYQDEIELRLLEIAQMIGYDLEFEISSLVEQIPEVLERIRSAVGTPHLDQKSSEYLQGLEGMIREFTSHPDATIKRMAASAFACGIIYSRNVLYPSGDKLWQYTYGNLECNWRTIIKCALLRHGPDTRRKDLLKKLGCENADKFRKSSKKNCLFNSAGQLTVPPLKFSAFEKAYKDVKRDIKTTIQTTADVEKLYSGIIHNKQKKAKQQKNRNIANRKNVNCKELVTPQAESNTLTAEQRACGAMAAKKLKEKQDKEKWERGVPMQSR